MATIHQVVGAIQATPLITKSSKFSGGRSVRSCGVYAEKTRFYNRETQTFHEAVKIDYWTSGYQHHADRSAAELALVFATLEAKGLVVLSVQEPVWSGCDLLTTNHYVLENN